MDYQIDNGTITVNLRTQIGRYASFTQYNQGITTISLNGLTLNEVDQFIKAFQELKSKIEKNNVPR
jgi:hypothetical protein